MLLHLIAFVSAANCRLFIVHVQYIVTHTHSSVVCIAIISVVVISLLLREGRSAEVDSAMPTFCRACYSCVHACENAMVGAQPFTILLFFKMTLEPTDFFYLLSWKLSSK